ncbi:MAG: AmmeMemoRadiSam system protein A [Bdellovibrio sp.]|nr:AmmeMemoRadiSam system protein A [Bdellovibrio sp.]
MEAKQLLSPEEKKYSLELARRSLKFYLDNKTPLPITEQDVIGVFGEKTPLLHSLGCFVSLHIEKKLRGCIGTIRSDEALFLNIANNAVLAGLKDPRFNPINKTDFVNSHLEISVMGQLELCRDLTQVVVGKHGLLVKKEFYQGLLLPQVPLEWKWNRETFLKQTCLKAGLPSDAVRDPMVEFYTFEALVFSEAVSR